VTGFAGGLPPDERDALARLADTLSPEQLLWASGYLAGIAAARGPVLATAAAAPVAAAAALPAVTLLYGSQTGNAARLAESFGARLRERGFPAKVIGMDHYKPAGLKTEAVLLVIASTHGEGDPPDSAREFHDFLHGKRAPRLETTRFSVLALGDASYRHFCKTGRDFDARLEELGAARLVPRVDCDVDFEDAADAWFEAVAAKIGPAAAPVPAAAPAPPAAVHSRKNPFAALLLDNVALTGRGSTKEVRHIELSLEGSGLVYQPGDALGVFPANWPERVAELVSVLGFSPESPVPGPGGREIPLEEALLLHHEITTPTLPFVEAYAALLPGSELSDWLKEEDAPRLREYLQGREIIDLVEAFPVPGLTPAHFVRLLRKLPTRLYSLASSPSAHPGEAHLTVAVVRYESHGRKRQGVASAFLADRVGEDGRVPVYVHENPKFRLPKDSEAPIVMIGPGTGVAPFRAFVAEREATGAAGRNWLFFGDRNFSTDFLYQREWLDHRKNGLLTRLDVAFSRDDDAKVYVQHRMLEQSRELYAWLEDRAHVYVCGDAGRMAGDVHEALITVVEREGGLDRERAEEYVRNLQAAERYQRDVY
jgi:sulfite reductase (NADPH) flavoprotein alpha-component